jgi:hypothetical protein
MPVARRREPVVYIPLDTAVQEHNLDREKLLQAIDEDDVEIAKLVDDTIIIVYESLRAWMALCWLLNSSTHGSANQPE